MGIAADSGAASPPGFWRARARWLGVLALAVLPPAVLSAGCGARALGDGSPEEEEWGTSELGGRGGAGGRGGGAGAATPSDPPGRLDLRGVRLPDCEPGLPVSAAGTRPCTYLYERDCYDDALLACGCACRGLANSQCIIGGFLNPDDPQRVSCAER